MYTMVEYFRENTAYGDVTTSDGDHTCTCIFVYLCTGADSGLIWLKLHASRVFGMLPMLLASSVFSMMMEGGQVGRQRGGEVGLGRGDSGGGH